MARSKYIYVIYAKRVGGPVEGAFTVKHEMYTWMERNRSKGDYYVQRFSDGQPERLPSNVARYVEDLQK